MTRFITTMTSLRTYFLSCCLRQHPDRNSLRKEGMQLAHSSMFSQFITGEKARLQESEAADHTASIIRKQKMQARSHLVFSILYILESPVQGMICPQFRWILPYYLTIKIPTHKHVQRPDSQVVMDSVKLTISTNHHNIKSMSSLINNRIEKLTHIYEYIYLHLFSYSFSHSFLAWE